MNILMFVVACSYLLIYASGKNLKKSPLYTKSMKHVVRKYNLPTYTYVILQKLHVPKEYFFVSIKFLLNNYFKLNLFNLTERVIFESSFIQFN